MTAATGYHAINSIRITPLFENNYKSEIKAKLFGRDEEIIKAAGLYRLQPWGQGNTLT